MFRSIDDLSKSVRQSLPRQLRSVILIGLIYDNCIIICWIDKKFYVTCDGHQSIRYEIDTDLVRILGLRADDYPNAITELIHDNDMVVFEAQLVNSTQMDTDDNNNACVWMVSQIIQVKHRAFCYVPNGKKLNNYFCY